MTTYTSTFGSTVAINVKSLAAFLTGCGGWAAWTAVPGWWGLSLFAIFLGIFSLTLTLDALRMMVRVYQREKAVYDYLAIGGAPKSSEIASGHDLDNAGMR